MPVSCPSGRVCISQALTTNCKASDEAEDLNYKLSIHFPDHGHRLMSCPRLFAVALASALLPFLSGFAAADPLVASASRGAPAADAVYNEPQAAPAARQMMAIAPQAGNLGGGFFEFLVTGRDGGAASVYRPAQSPRMTARYAPDVQPRRSIDPIYLRQQVEFDGRAQPGTVVVDTAHKFLYLVEPGKRALRYGIGVGREGFTWSGVQSISRKAEWPDWTPPAEMLKRRPDLPTHMEGGPANPLGARALYLGSSLYRIHGTNEPYTIGTSVSSGCIRMMNEDVIDLYGRVKVGTKVVVM